MLVHFIFGSRTRSLNDKFDLNDFFYNIKVQKSFTFVLFKLEIWLTNKIRLMPRVSKLKENVIGDRMLLHTSNSNLINVKCVCECIYNANKLEQKCD